jgi:hypothetical protein
LLCGEVIQGLADSDEIADHNRMAFFERALQLCSALMISGVENNVMASFHELGGGEQAEPGR